MSKSLGKPDRELEELRSKVAAAAKDLQPHHYSWMIEAARDHFMKEIERLELQVVRHQELANAPYVHYLRETTRESETADAVRFLEQYQKVVTFLIALGRFNEHYRALGLFAALREWWKHNSPFKEQ